jgi:phosphoribosylanthranilate isomerase
MWLKICGIRDQTTWQACAQAGASAIGFVFWQESPRFIMPDEAASIGTPGSGIERVGVFCDAPRESILSAFKIARLDWVQLHGSESVEFATSLGLPWVKAFRVGKAFEPGQVTPYFPGAFQNRYILDAKAGSMPGGTGTRFDWKLAIQARNELPAGSRLILSGGLGIENIQQAANQVAPFGMDLSSSLESSRGVKDPSLIRRLGDQVRALKAVPGKDPASRAQGD